MATRKIELEGPKTTTIYKGIRIWKRDFLDILSSIEQAGLAFEIQDEKYKYDDANDFISKIPAAIDSFKIIVLNKPEEKKTGSFSIDFNRNMIMPFLFTYSEDTKLLDAEKKIDYIIKQCRKPISEIGNSRLGTAAVTIVAISTGIPLVGLQLFISNKIKSVWFLFLDLFVWLAITYTFYIVLTRTVQRLFGCDLWLWKDKGENTWWARNGDKIMVEVVKGVILLILGGIGGYLMPHR